MNDDDKQLRFIANVMMVAICFGIVVLVITFYFMYQQNKTAEARTIAANSQNDAAPANPDSVADLQSLVGGTTISSTNLIKPSTVQSPLAPKNLN